MGGIYTDVLWSLSSFLFASQQPRIFCHYKKVAKCFNKKQYFLFPQEGEGIAGYLKIARYEDILPLKDFLNQQTTDTEKLEIPMAGLMPIQNMFIKNWKKTYAYRHTHAYTRTHAQNYTHMSSYINVTAGQFFISVPCLLLGWWYLMGKSLCLEDHFPLVCEHI